MKTKCSLDINLNPLYHIAIGSFNGLIGKKQERERKTRFYFLQKERKLISRHIA